jgi:hypothetical protein
MTEYGVAPRAQQSLARPRRLAPRYPVRLKLRVRCPQRAVHEYDVRDVSYGGLFVATDDCPALFSEVELWLPLPDGGEARLRARVVHAVTLSKAQATGVSAGMGLQFDGLSSAEAQAVAYTVGQARAEHVRRRRVRRRHAPDDAAHQLDPMLGYLLDAVDDETDPEGLAERLGLPLDTTEEMVHELLHLQLVELGADTTQALPAGEPASAVVEKPQTLLKRGLPKTTQAELEALWPTLPQLNHYEVLGVTVADSGEYIRKRFFELGKLFHPDSYYRQLQPQDLHKLERVFARVSEAYGVLSRERSRRDYDHYLTSKRALAGAAPLALTTGTQPHGPSVHEHKKTLPGPHEPVLTLRPLQTLTAAETARDVGQLHEAYQLLASLRGLRIVDRLLELRIAQLRKQLASALRGELIAQARYEEQHQQWASAAQSWLGVCEGEPDDPAPYRCAAIALLEAHADLQHALKLAKLAAARAPADAETRRVLARTYLAAGLRLNARHELELATQLSEKRPVSGKSDQTSADRD